MDILNRQRIKVDFKKPVTNETLSYRQYDTNIIEIEILDDGVAADLSVITSIVANLQRPDKKVYSHVLTRVGNLLTIRLENIEMEHVGELNLAVHFYSSENRLSTAKIKVYIEGSIETGEIPTHQEISIIEGLVELVNESIEGIREYDDRISGLETDLSDRGVNAKANGVRGDIVTNDSVRLQALINEVKQRVVASNFTADNVIVIPAGRYRLETQLIMSPFLKLKAAGLVIFETYIENGSALWITAQGTDADYSTILAEQQWYRSPILNGTDGGIVFVNKLERDTSNSTAIEIGSRTDLGIARPTSRYSLVDVGVQNYNIGLKMNRFRHSLGTFERLHLSRNTTNVVFGDTGQNFVGVPKLFQFNNSIFTSGGTGIRWFSDGFDTHFTNCTFDTMNTVFHASRTYKMITMTGGYIEAINNHILLEDTPDGSDAQIPLMTRFSGVSAFVKKDVMFVGSSKVHLTLDGFEYRQASGAASTPTIEHSFLIDNRITLKQQNISLQSQIILPQQRTNRIHDWTFEKESTGFKGIRDTLNNFGLRGEFVQYEMVDSDSVLGGKALKITGTANGAWGLIYGLRNAKVRGGELVVVNMGIKQTALADFTINIRFYDRNDEVITNVEQPFGWLGSINPQVDSWFYPDRAVRTVAPQNSESFAVEFTAHSAGLVSNSVYFTGLYATVI